MLREPLTEEKRDMLDIVLTGAVPAERRLHAAGPPKKDGAARESRRCPYCDDELDEDDEHRYWWWKAWKRKRATFLRAIECAVHRSLGLRKIRHNTDWHKATRTVMVFPDGPGLATRAQQLEAKTEELRRRGRADWEGQPRIDDKY